jgi:hypothetical protein
VTSAERMSGLELLIEAAEVLEEVSEACEDPGDAVRLSDLAQRVRSYLASSRPTTPLGMPQIPAAPHPHVGEVVAHPASQPSHLRIVPR